MNPADVADQLEKAEELLKGAEGAVENAREYNDDDPRFAKLAEAIDTARTLTGEIWGDVQGWLDDYERTHER